MVGSSGHVFNRTILQSLDIGAMLNCSTRLRGMAAASRRTKFIVWGVVLALFAGGAWFAYSTLRASFQPLGVIANPFPTDTQRPAGSDAPRGPVNFLVFGQAAGQHQTLSVFHLADGRRRVDIVNFPRNFAQVTDIQDIPGTVSEIEALTGARMEHVMRWDLEFLTRLETAPGAAAAVLTDPTALDADDVWQSVLQETLSVQDAGQLRTLASTLTPFVDADAQLDTGRITDLAKSLRHVSPENVSSCVLPEALTDQEQAKLQRFFETGGPRRCAEMF